MLKHLLFYFGLSLFFGISHRTNLITISETNHQRNNFLQTGCIDGTIFNDQNINGINDTEPGIDQITVNIFDCDNNQIGTTSSNASGDWQICGLQDNTMYRVELNLSSAQADIYQNSLVGLNNGTDVQFATTTDIIDFGLVEIERPSYIITPCYNYAGYQGTYATNEALVGLPINKIMDPNTDATTQIIKYASHEEIGTTYGLAINQNTKKAYAAAYMKRHTGFGPGGTGAIYEVDLTLTSPPTVLADLNAIYGANTAGVNPHDFAETDVCSEPSGGTSNHMCWFNDVDTWDEVGHSSLADLDISEDQSTLYVLNLEDRSVYPIEIANPSAVQTPFPFPLDQATDANISLKPRDPAYDIRPFGLTYHNGLVYVGAVDSEQSRDRDNIGSQIGGSVIYIYSLDPVTGIWTVVLEEDVQRAGIGGSTNNFMHWNDEYIGDYKDKRHIVVSDIEFDGDDLIVGLKEISGDQFGSNQGPPIAADSTLLSFTSIAGDILRFCYDAPTSSFNFENNGTCGGQTSAGVNSGYGWPEASTPRGSYYTGDYFDSSHPQTSFGGFWKDPSDNRLYSTVFELTAVFQSGIKSFDNTTGLTEEIYIVIPDTRANGAFGKAASLGDLESFANAIPVEIGNFVWSDSIENGIQDPCEMGIDNMIVQIYNDAGLLIGQDTTVAGQYYFNLNNVDTTGITVDMSGGATPNSYWSGLAPDTDYYVVFADGQFDQSNNFTTIADTVYPGVSTFDANSNGSDNIDSDIDPANLSTALGAIPMGLPFIFITTDTLGYGDYKYDLGLIAPDFDLALTKTLNTATSANPILVASNVTFDITVVNQGNVNAYDIDIADYFDPSEFNFSNLIAPASSAQGASVSVVGVGPDFQIEQLAAGDAVVVQLNFTIDNNFTGTSAINNAEIVDASATDNGPTAIDQDSPLSMLNDGTANELATDNDIADDSTGGIDNPADEDDYDSALVLIECKAQICLPIDIIITRN